VFAEWRDGVDGYCISNENKMATCCKDVEKPLGLYSTGQLYTCGHSVAFRIVDVGQACASDGIALTVSERESEPLNRPGSVFVSVSGESTDIQVTDHFNLCINHLPIIFAEMTVLYLNMTTSHMCGLIVDCTRHVCVPLSPQQVIFNVSLT